MLKGCLDAANITDNQTAIVRMSQHRRRRDRAAGGAGAVIQMTCRDRNRLAMQSDLLGAYALGMRNILCLTGDHQSFGNHPKAKNVHDLDSMQLVQMVVGLRDKHCFQCGEEIKGVEPRFFVGAAENPFGDPFEWRPYRAGQEGQGRRGLHPDPVDLQRDEVPRVHEARGDLGVHKQVYILAGVGPLKSPGMANTCATRSPAWTCRTRSSSAWRPPPRASKEDKKATAAANSEEGIKICVEMIQQMREIEGVAGVHIMAIEWEEAVRAIGEGAGLLPRPELEPPCRGGRRSDP